MRDEISKKRTKKNSLREYKNYFFKRKISEIRKFSHSILFFVFTDSLQGYFERKLLNNLLNNYNLLERPVANESEPLEVKFGLTLQQIIDVVSFTLERKKIYNFKN